MKIESKYKLGIFKNGRSVFGEVVLEIESLPNSKEHEIIENYRGLRFQGQGGIESIPKEGYNSWKEGIRHGVFYGLRMILDERKFKVTILEGN